jgi:ribosomal protein S18 acetylase RimI-like enzyme
MNRLIRAVVRRATLSDVQTVVSFNAALASETEHRALDLRLLQAGVKALLQDPGKGWYAVAEISSESGPPAVIGQILVTFEWSDWRNGNFWWLQSLYVHPKYRQQGIFRQLYEYVLAQAHENHENICGFRLYVEENNLQAQQVYATLGFEKTIYHMYEKGLSWTHPSSPQSIS